jgi:hypothetical protein
MSAVLDSERVWLKEAAARSSGTPRPLGLHARQIGQDASTLATDLRGAAADAEILLTQRMKHHPWSTLGIAAGAGYVLGGGLRARFTMVMLGVATRLVGVLAMRELGERIAPRGPRPPTVGKTENGSVRHKETP